MPPHATTEIVFDDAQVMRLPAYARGLKLVRLGVYLMLAQLVISIVVVVKAFGGSSNADEWVKYLYWANVAAVGGMIVGTLMAVPEFRRTRMPLQRLLVAVVALAVTALCWVWSYRIINSFYEALRAPSHDTDFLTSLDNLESTLTSTLDKLDTLHYVTILKDIAYPIGLLAIVRSIRQTAVANDHYALRDASSQVSSLVVGMCLMDVLQNLLSTFNFLGPIGGLILLAGALFILGFWIYTHLRLGKFLKAAAILVYEPHNLPVATVIVRGKPTEAAGAADGSDAPVRPSGRIKSPTAPAAQFPRDPAAGSASQPVITVAAELRPVIAPRAETAPGAPADEPKLLR